MILRPLWAVLLLLFLAVPTSFAQGGLHSHIQLIHATQDLGPVDVYVSEKLIFENVAYQSATSYEGILYGDHLFRMYEAGMDTAGATPLAEGEATLDLDSRGVLTVIGEASEPLLVLRMGARLASTSPQTELFLVHGAPDTGTVDLILRDPRDDNRVIALVYNNVAYSRATVYMGLPLEPFNYELVQSNTNQILATFYHNLSGFANGSGVLITMGKGTTTGEGLTLIGYDVEGTRYDPVISTSVQEDLPSETSNPVQVYPNPFRTEATLTYDLPEAGPVTLRVVDLQGRIVATLHDGWHAAGALQSTWDGLLDSGSPAPNGVYVAQLLGPNGTSAKPLVLAR